MLHVRLEPPTDIATCCRGQVLEGRSHALLQETGVNLVDIIREEGFYVRERRMSAPTKVRKEGKFGSALPIELPTEPEMDKAAQQCVPLTVAAKPSPPD